MDVITYALAKKYVDSKIGSIEAGTAVADRQVVDALPETGKEGVVYLVPQESGQYAEYVWKDGAFEKVRDTDLDSVVSEGYLYGGKFYKDAEHKEEIITKPDNIYVDSSSGDLYYYDTAAREFKKILQEASAETSGVLKMYGADGENEDGTMNQKAIKETIDSKIEIAFGNVILLDGGSAD